MSPIRVNWLSPGLVILLGKTCAKPGPGCGNVGDNFSSSTGHRQLSPGSPQPLWTKTHALSRKKDAFPHIHSAYYYDYRDIDRKPEHPSSRAETVENFGRTSEVQSPAIPLEWRRGRPQGPLRLSSVHSSVENLPPLKSSAPGRPPQSVEGGMMVADASAPPGGRRKPQRHHNPVAPSPAARASALPAGSRRAVPDCQEADTR